MKNGFIVVSKSNCYYMGTTLTRVLVTELIKKAHVFNSKEDVIKEFTNKKLLGLSSEYFKVYEVDSALNTQVIYSIGSFKTESGEACYKLNVEKDIALQKTIDDFVSTIDDIESTEKKADIDLSVNYAIKVIEETQKGRYNEINTYFYELEDDRQIITTTDLRKAKYYSLVEAYKMYLKLNKINERCEYAIQRIGINLTESVKGTPCWIETVLDEDGVVEDPVEEYKLWFLCVDNDQYIYCNDEDEMILMNDASLATPYKSLEDARDGMKKYKSLHADTDMVILEYTYNVMMTNIDA